MPQAVWSGQLSFGLVNIPVKLYSATASHKVRFHQYDPYSGQRIRYRRVATGPPPEDVSPRREAAASEPASPRSRAEGDDLSRAERDDLPPPRPTATEPREVEVPWEEIVKGFEIEPGRVVTVTREELESVEPERSRVLEVEQFVHLRDIDPVYFDKSYFVVPETGAGAERPYWLLHRAMRAGAEVAVGRFVMRTKEYLAAVRAAEDVLMLQTLFYADEVRDPNKILFPPAAEPPEREVRMARQLIDALTGDWNPARHRDEHRERLLDLLRSKAGEARTIPPTEEVSSPAVVDLLESLKASIEAAKQARSSGQSKTG